MGEYVAASLFPGGDRTDAFRRGPLFFYPPFFPSRPPSPPLWWTGGRGRSVGVGPKDLGVPRTSRPRRCCQHRGDKGPFRMMEETESTGIPTRAGYVALVGRPNAGKSTLMNALVGERLSIVTSRAQTTWTRVTGIRSEGGVQMIFLDTPGLLQVRDLHQRVMLEEAHEALRDADAVLLLLDGARPLDEAEEAVVRTALEESRAPLRIALNKVDRLDDAAIERLSSGARASFGVPVHAISAREGIGLDPLLEDLAGLLPESPFLYPDDEVGTQPVRFFVAEMVRETVFEQFEDEIPYAVVAAVEDFREGEDPVYIQVTLYVEAKSQKGILIGKGGKAIRALGATSRKKIETFLDRRVYLDLWVKPLAGWRRKRQHLRRLGYRVPEET